MTATEAAEAANPNARRSYSRPIAQARATSVVIAAPVLSEEESRAAGGVIAEAARVDERQAVSEQGRIRLKAVEPRPGIVHLLQCVAPDDATGGELTGGNIGNVEDVGYAQIEVPAAGSAGTAELAVAPGHRGRGFGRHLVDAVLAEAERASPGEPVEFWAHGGHPAARHLADAYGAELVRELRQLRRPVSAPGTADASGASGTAEAAEAAEELPPLPAGVTVRTFRPGRDDEAWLRLNALAFAHHPEQGSWTAQDLADRFAEPWFDPSGFFLATRGDRLVGFHWTKVHPEGLGEVYVVGVDPEEQGNGLGRALTAIGLRHLAEDRGQRTVLLYVDADNPAALRVYERLGFTIHEVDLMYRVQSR